MSFLYQSTIKEIGALIQTFQEEEMIIFFGEQAPDTLKDFCYIIEVQPMEGTLSAGDSLHLGEKVVTITSVGEVAQKNLVDLGHLTVSFNGATEAEMPGCIHVQGGQNTPLSIGTPIRISR